MSTFPRSLATYPGYDTYINLDVGSLECVYLKKPTDELWDYFTLFFAALQHHVDFFTSRLEGIFEDPGAEQVPTIVPRMYYFIELSNASRHLYQSNNSWHYHVHHP